MNCLPQRVSVSSMIACVPLFSDLSPGELAAITKSARQIRFARGDMLFRRDDRCTGLFVIAYGQAKLFCSSALGNEKILDILDQGQTLGESALFQGESYQMFAQALSDCSLLHIAKARILDTVDHNQLFARRVIAHLSQRVLELMLDLESYSLHSGRQRVVNYLVREAHRAKQVSSDLQQTGAEHSVAVEEPGRMVIRLPTSKAVIASYLNLTPEHFSRILNELSACRLLAVVGRDIHIPDLAQLQKNECQTGVWLSDESHKAPDLIDTVRRRARRFPVKQGDVPPSRQRRHFKTVDAAC